MMGLFQAKSQDLHMTPVCLEVIITKTQGTSKAYTKAMTLDQRENA